MKGKIKFDLNNPEDQSKFKRVFKADDMAFALFEILRNTKKQLEWSLEGKDIDKYDTLELIYEKIWDIVNEHNIDIDDII